MEQYFFNSDVIELIETAERTLKKGSKYLVKAKNLIKNETNSYVLLINRPGFDNDGRVR